MFEARDSRVGALLMRSLDCALEFATLGEYRLGGVAENQVQQPSAPDAPPRERPVATRVQPATAAARRRQQLAKDLDAAMAEAASSRACEARTTSRRPVAATRRTRPRYRAGAAPPPPQPCATVPGDA